MALDQIRWLPGVWVFSPVPPLLAASQCPLTGTLLGLHPAVRCLSQSQESGGREPSRRAQTWIEKSSSVSEVLLAENLPPAFAFFIHSFSNYLFLTFAELGTVLDPKATVMLRLHLCPLIGGTGVGEQTQPV